MSDFVLHLRGLPWSATAQDVQQFLDGVYIVNGVNGIHLTTMPDGRSSGECYVEVMSNQDLENGLTKDKSHMGKRYIEVSKSSAVAMNKVLSRMGSGEMPEPILRLRGLPFGCSKEEVAHFFSGLKIVPNGIILLEDGQGRTAGEGFVKFISTAVAEEALGKDKERIGHRYVEVFKSSDQELSSAITRQRRMFGSGVDDGGFRGGFRGGRGGMRGGGMMGSRGGGGGGRGGARFGANGGAGDMPPLMGSMGGRPGPYDRPGGNMGGGGGMARNMKGGMRGRRRPESGDHCRMGMRGLPFAATEKDIVEFFSPLKPININLKYSSEGKALGKASIEFATHKEAKMAMTKDRDSMGHRYIELFMDCGHEEMGGEQTEGYGMDVGPASGRGGGMDVGPAPGRGGGMFNNRGGSNNNMWGMGRGDGGNSMGPGGGRRPDGDMRISPDDFIQQLGGPTAVRQFTTKILDALHYKSGGGRGQQGGGNQGYNNRYNQGGYNQGSYGQSMDCYNQGYSEPSQEYWQENDQGYGYGQQYNQY